MRWIDAESAEYDERRRLFNAMIDDRPRIIAACEGSADVKDALCRRHVKTDPRTATEN